MIVYGGWNRIALENIVGTENKRKKIDINSMVNVFRMSVMKTKKQLCVDILTLN
jgi:hypothetical protein